MRGRWGPVLILALLAAGCGGSQDSAAGEGAASRADTPTLRTLASGGLRFPFLFRRGTGRWYCLTAFTAAGPVADEQFFYGGDPSDIPLAGDWTGSGRLSVGVYRRSTGGWCLLESRNSAGPVSDSKFTYGGNPYDLPMVGDFDGNGISDPALYRASTQTWYLLTGRGPSGPVSDLQVRMRSTSPAALPVVGDFDGDGRSDLATFEPNGGLWRIDTNRDGEPEAAFVYGGAPLDRPLSGDLDGDGDDDPTLYRASSGEWFALTEWTSAGPSADLKFRYGGDPTDFAVLGDWNGDGADEPAVYRQGTGIWYLVTGHTNGTPSADVKLPYGGDPTDLPVTAAPVLLAGHAPSWKGLDFQQPATSPATWAWTLALGDMDLDGVLDALLPSFGSQVGMLRGRGDGTFERVRQLAVMATTAAAVADFNGDSVPDVAGQAAGAGGLSVALGDGTGGVGPAFGIPGTSGRDLAIADFDGDGDLDVAGADDGYDRVYVTLGRGDGTFGDRVLYDPRVTSTWDVSRLVAVDVTADGIPDLVVGDEGEKQVIAMDGVGDGTFATPRLLVPDAVETHGGFTTGDYDEDGWPDLAVQGGETLQEPSLTLILSQGAGTYAVAARLPGGERPNRPVTADVDGDGHLDLVTGGGSSVRALLGQGDGTFVPGPRLGVPAQPESLAVADLDGDGRQDFLASCTYEGVLAFLSGDGAGGAAGARDHQPGTNPRWLEAADLDGDGLDDLVVADGGLDEQARYGLSVLYQNPDGTMRDPVRIATSNRGWMAVEARDMNRDGRVDLVCLGNSSSEGFLTVFRRQADGTYGGDGFAARLLGEQWALLVDDLDGDGIPDWAISHQFDGTARTEIYRGDGQGWHASRTLVSTAGRHMLSVDSDLDGRREIVWVLASGALALGRSSGGMQFDDVQVIPTGEIGNLLTGGIATGDFDRDGYPDVVQTVSAGVAIQSLAPGRRRWKVGLPDLARQVATADLDGDGFLDVAVNCDGIVRILRGRGDGTLVEATTLWGATLGRLLTVLRGRGGVPTLVDGTGNARVRVHRRR